MYTMQTDTVLLLLVIS